MAKQSTKDLLAEIKKAGSITEAQMNLLKRRANESSEAQMNLLKRRANENKEDWKLIRDFNWTDEEILITGAYEQKGYKWLLNQYKTPTGKERQNNPFGYREQLALETMENMYFLGFYDAGNLWRTFYVPIYQVCGENQCFDYYVSGGKIEIIG
jgi:hypothetical protein